MTTSHVKTSLGLFIFICLSYVAANSTVVSQSSPANISDVPNVPRQEFGGNDDYPELGFFGTMGGDEWINPSSPEVLAAAQFALGYVNEYSYSNHILGIFRIIAATKQVVEGSMYGIKFQVANTGCLKDSPDLDENCDIIDPDTAVRSDPDFNTCIAQVWDQDWASPRYELQNLKCSKELRKEFPGAADPNARAKSG